MSEKINNHYANYDEEGRLFRDNAHKPEYLTTIRYFDKLFVPNSKILDACAGAGRYAFYLADKGHMVTAADLSEHHVGIMKASPYADKLADIRTCNVLNLSDFADNSFDVVLCMGALYHLRDDTDKRQAIAECVRVCRPGGIVALAYITRIGCVYLELNENANNIAELLAFTRGDVDSIFVPTTSAAIEEMAINSGLEKLHNIGTDGLVYAAVDKLNNAYQEDFNTYMEFHYSICEMPDVVGATLHGLWIGRKKLC